MNAPSAARCTLAALAALACGSLTDPASSDELESIDPPFEAAGAQPASNPDSDAVAAPLAPLRDYLDVPSSDVGLRVSAVTNFEFTPPPIGPVPAGVSAWADERTRYAASWSTVDAISGRADLRLDFTFNRGPGRFDEWVAIGIWDQEVDVRSLSTLVVWLSSDRPRQVRIRLLSAAYADELGGISEDFGVERQALSEPRAFVIDLREFYYPWWIPDAVWGFPVSDVEALELVLQRFEGIIFQPIARIDTSGELIADSDAGFLRIDNIYFR